MSLGQKLNELRPTQVEHCNFFTNSRAITLKKLNKSTRIYPGALLHMLINISVKFHDSMSNTFLEQSGQLVPWSARPLVNSTPFWSTRPLLLVNSSSKSQLVPNMVNSSLLSIYSPLLCCKSMSLNSSLM
jgi:hypothetical protein